MAGVGKLLKQAAKMQKKMAAVQEELAEKEIDVSCGGGAVSIKINGQGEFLALKIDREFFQEDPEIVESTLLSAIQEASNKAKAYNEAEMNKVSEGMQFPGLM